MFRIDAVQPLCNARVRSAEKARYATQDEVVHLFLIEHVHAGAVLMGVAQCQLALRGLGNQTVNVPAIILWVSAAMRRRSAASDVQIEKAG